MYVLRDVRDSGVLMANEWLYFLKALDTGLSVISISRSFMSDSWRPCGL